MSHRIACWAVMLLCATNSALAFAQSKPEVAGVSSSGNQPDRAASTQGPDASSEDWRRTSSTMHVDADNQAMIDALGPAPNLSQAEILSSAGTYGDFSRYLQLLPGVVWNSDLSNEVLVR